MFAAAQQQHPHHHHHQQQQQQQPQQQQQRPAAGGGGGGGGGATAPPAASSAEEEALKRSTDCVYFLASPLTCKKGSECEYRHSEYARVNPRDCYFWLNGNCLNPKCGFRHPPLDGLLGTQVAASAGSALPPSVTAPAPAPAPATHTPYNPSKQAVPCIFFQKGLCLKGDRCAFSHGLSPLNSKVPKPIAPTPAAEAPSQKKAFGGLQKSAQEQKIQQTNSLKVVQATAEAKPAPKPESIQPRNSTVERNALLPKILDDEVPSYKTTVASVSNGNSSRSSRAHHAIVADDTVFQNGKDADEFLRESSPGFDVLVDDESGDADFYHGEDQYGRTRVHDEGNLNSMEDYDIGHSADYSSMADFDQETYHDPRGYDLQGQYGWDQHRASSERMPVGPEHGERRGYSKGGNPECIDESDLRHRLSKHRRVNGLRSVVSQDFVPDNHFGERGYHSSSQKDSHHSSSRDIGSRLRGRIKLPDCSPNKGSDYQAERETDRVRSRARLSPGRTQVASHSGGRLRNRLKPRADEEDDNDGRNFRGTRMRNVDDRSTDFAGPKSLAELKVSKNVEGRVQQSLGKRKHHEDHQPSEGDLSFEGPMPLSEILKRKRGAEAAASGGRTSPLNKDGNNLKDNKETLNGLNDNTETVKVEGISQVLPDKDKSSSAIAIKDSCDQSSEQPKLVEPETDGLNLDGAMEGQEYEGEYQGDEEYEYEQGEEGEYYEEGENPEGEEEYVEEEDGEEFCQENGDGALMSGEDNLLE